MLRRIELAQATYPYLVAERDGTILGYAYAGLHNPRSAYRWAAEVTVYVDRAAHRQGVGRSLYDALFARLRDQGFVTLLAGITLPNAGSVGLHESFGFERAAVYRGVGYKFGEWRDVGWWQLDLAERPTDAPPEPRAPAR